MKPCSVACDNYKILECMYLLTQAFFLQNTVFYGEYSDFLIFESLLKMSPHEKNVKSYTTRVFTMQYAYHVCNDIDPFGVKPKLQYVNCLRPLEV